MASAGFIFLLAGQLFVERLNSIQPDIASVSSLNMGAKAPLVFCLFSPLERLNFP